MAGAARGGTEVQVRVGLGHVLGAAAGLRETDRIRDVLGDRPKWHAVRGHLHELDGDHGAAAEAYADASRRATNLAERDHLIRQAVRVRAEGLDGTENGLPKPG